MEVIQFSQVSNVDKLIQHRHVQNRPFQCTVCASTFRLKKHVRKHIRDGHQQELQNLCKFIDRTYVLHFLSEISCVSSLKPHYY